MQAETTARTPTVARLARLGVVIGALVALLLSATVPAWSHAGLVSSEPGADATMDRPPGQVRVWFDKPVELLRGGLEVLGEDGIRVDLGDIGHGQGQEEVTVSLPEDLSAGTYTARWRVQTADAHPQEGSWTFTAQDPPDDDAGAASASDGEAAAVTRSSSEDASTTNARPQDHGHNGELAGDLVPAQQGETQAQRAVVPLALLAGLLVAGLAALVLWRAGEFGGTRRS